MPTWRDQGSHTYANLSYGTGYADTLGMTTLTMTIDRSPLSLSATASESDVEQYRIRLEDELSRALPGIDVRVMAADVLGYECTGDCLTVEQMRTITRVWLDTAADIAA